MTDDATAPASVFDEAPAAWALWQFAVARISEAEVRKFAKLMADYHDEISRDNAEKIRQDYGKPRWPDDEPEYAYGINHATHDAADLIDPDKQEQP